MVFMRVESCKAYTNISKDSVLKVQIENRFFSIE